MEPRRPEPKKERVYLNEEDTDKENWLQFIWTDFYWSILRCEDIHNYYTSQFIWKSPPLEWHEWWFDDIVLQFPEYYNIILITDQQTIFMDITKDIESCNEGIQSQKLSFIADV